jgi:hypothetical protein
MYSILCANTASCIADAEAILYVLYVLTYIGVLRDAWVLAVCPFGPPEAGAV